MSVVKQWIIIKLESETLDSKEPIKYISKIIYDKNNFCIIHKESLDQEISIFLTFYNNNFIRGFIYKNKVEYIVNNITMFSSLQIKNICYDFICICNYVI